MGTELSSAILCGFVDSSSTAFVSGAHGGHAHRLLIRPTMRLAFA